jgi:hypothetical protein
MRIRPLYLIGLGCSVDKKNKTIKSLQLEEFELCLQILLTAAHLIMNATGKTYVLNSKNINKHALLIIITKQKNIRFC